MITNKAPSISDVEVLPRAIDIMAALERREISARELLLQTYQVIARRNPHINAICTLVDLDTVLPQADQIDCARVAGDPLGPLAGLPIAVKDLAATRGILTTLGSTLFKDHIPDTDCLLVERLRAAGAIIIGKTNTPEFGAGSHTFNDVFGATHNPYALNLTAGGSSGGAAAALSAGLVHLADGSDMGGSLRNPAAYCNVVGMRPSLGRVPSWPMVPLPCARMSVEGPMARTVEDCAFFLDAIAGPDKRDPLSQALPPMAPAHPIAPVENRLRLGWAPQPAGLPVDQEIAAVLAKAPSLLSGLGHHVEEIALEALSDAMEIFKINRAASYAALAGELYHQHKDKLKPTLATNIAQGLQLTDADIEKAERSRQRVSVMLNTLFDTYDYLLMPSTQVMPFPIETEYPTEINGQAMSSYIDWMSVCCILSPFGVPCLSVPAGFSATGLPVGMQIVGRPQDDSGVLQLAYLFQQHTHYWKQQPDMAW